MFDNFLEDLKGFKGSVGDFFDTGINMIGGSSAKDLASSLLGSVSTVNKEKMSLASISKEGLINGQTRAKDATPTNAKASVDPGDLEREWLARLQRFANIENTQVKNK